MEKEKRNLLIICSDQHSKRVAGCYADEYAITPNLDKLAAQGVLFENAYTVCPMCVPARAAMATGQYPFAGGYWDNAHPYNGEEKSFGHVLNEHGIDFTSIGKLHFKDNSINTGFCHQVIPMHVKDGVGEPAQCLRSKEILKPQQKQGIEAAGPAETDYARYDRQIAEKTCEYLKEKDRASDDGPWVLHVGFVNPHPPHKAPPEFFDQYRETELPQPVQYSLEERPMHPVLENIRRFNDLQGEFSPDILLKMKRTYYAKVTFLDAMIGQILDCLKETRFANNTYIIYLSDHGESLGNHGLWFKQNMYEESAGIPLLIAGPGIPRGAKSKTVVQNTDLYGTVLDCMGIPNGIPESKSWLPYARGQEEDRIAFSEFHCCGAFEDIYMIRKGPYKLVYYRNLESQLFDLEKDPNELTDLAGEASYQDVLKELKNALYAIVDVEGTNTRCRESQHRVVEKFGGFANFDESAKWKTIGSPIPEECRGDGGGTV